MIECAVCRLDRSRLRRVKVSKFGDVAVFTRNDPASDRGFTSSGRCLMSSGSRVAASVRGVAVGGSCFVRGEAASPPYVAFVSFPDGGSGIGLLLRRNTLAVATGGGVRAVRVTCSETGLVLPFLSGRPRFHVAVGLEGGVGRRCRTHVGPSDGKGMFGARGRLPRSGSIMAVGLVSAIGQTSSKWLLDKPQAGFAAAVVVTACRAGDAATACIVQCAGLEASGHG